MSPFAYHYFYLTVSFPAEADIRVPTKLLISGSDLN